MQRLVGVQLVVIVLALGCGSSASPNPVELSVKASWADPCKGPLDLVIKSEPGAMVDYGSSRGMVPESGYLYAQAHGMTSERITVTAKLDDRTSAPVVVDVPPPQPPVTAVSSSAHVTATARGEKLGDFEYKDKKQDRELVVVELESCRLKPGTVEAPHVKVEVTGTRAIATIDSTFPWLTTPGTEDPPFEVQFELPTNRGTTIPIAVRGRSQPSKADLARFASIAKAPFSNVMDPSRAPRPRSLLRVSYGTHVDRALLGPGHTPTDAVYVTLEDTEMREHPACFYGRSGLEGAATRTQWTRTVVVHAAKTGRVVGRRTFAGGLPKPCPSVMLFNRNGGSSESLDGSDPDEKQIDAFVASFR